MTGIKVHGNPFAGSSMIVFATLYEKGIEFQFIPVDMRSGEHKKEPFLSLNPFGQVPAFEDGDLKLIESRAISRYIAHEYADRGNQLLCPGKAMAIMSVWMEVEAHQCTPVASKLVWELVLKPMLGMTTDEAAVPELEDKLGKVLDVYEARLSKSKYLACDSFTLADLHHLPALGYLMNTQVKKIYEARPHVCAWAADITARPAWAKVLEMQKRQKT